MYNLEENFEDWWEKNCEDIKLSKTQVKAIWMAGGQEGFKVGFNKGRKEAVKENW